MAWRYLAQDLLTREWLHHDMPLAEVEIEESLSDPPLITASVEPEFSGLRDASGRRVLDEWATAIYAEEGQTIRGGGILVRSVFDDEAERWSLEIPGKSYYPKGLPFLGHIKEWEPDAFDMVRAIWSHLLDQPDGDIGLLIDQHKAGLIAGDVKPPKEPVKPKRRKGESRDHYGKRRDAWDKDHQAWQDKYGDREPYELAWWETPDAGDEIDQLSREVGFDWREAWRWNGDDVETRIVLGAPTLGRRRTDLRFAEGENLQVIPDLERDGDDFANQTFVLGSGEGRKTRRATAGQRDGRARRVRVVSAKDEHRQSRLASIARSEHSRYRHLDSFSEIAVWDHPNAPLGSVSMGDEILVDANLGWVDAQVWCRVVGKRTRPDNDGVRTLQLVRADRS